MQIIQTQNAPQPAGHYSQAVAHNGMLFVAGQLPIDPQDPKRPVGSIEDQTRQALANVGSILEAAGTSFARVLQMTVYITDIELWSSVNEVYGEILGDARPARAIVPTRELHHGYQIEIQAVAAVD